MVDMKKQIEHLKAAIINFQMVVAHLKASNSFEQLPSGYGIETYEDTISNLIGSVEEWIKANKTTKIRIDFKHEKELIKK